MNSLIQKHSKEIIEACRNHKVKSIALFGSAAKDTMNEKSDVDLLVEFSSEVEVLDYADNYFSLLEKLEKIVQRKVDLVSLKSIKNPILLKEINGCKLDLYAA